VAVVTVPVTSSVPPVAVIVPVLVAIFAAIVPDPVRTAGLVMVRPLASVSVPPSIWIVPLVAVCAALMVRLPPEPISSVWLALFSAIAAAEVAVPEIFVVLLATVSIASWTPLLTVPWISSVPPLPATKPVPDSVVPAATVPKPPSCPVTVTPLASLSVPPISWSMLPVPTVWAALRVTLALAPICSVVVVPVESPVIAAATVAVPSSFRTELLLIASTTPLAIVPDTSSVPPLAVIEPAPLIVPPTVTVPVPLIVPLRERPPPESLMVPPAMVTAPAVTVMPEVPVTFSVFAPMARVAVDLLSVSELRLLVLPLTVTV
jgi:hypothetical protein